MARSEISRPYPLGVTLLEGAANVAICSETASAIELCVFRDGTKARRALSERTGHVFHGHVPDLGVGSRYALRVQEGWAPERGLRHTEGPTDDEAVNERRDRQRRNLLATRWSSATEFTDQIGSVGRGSKRLRRRRMRPEPLDHLIQTPVGRASWCGMSWVRRASFISASKRCLFPSTSDCRAARSSSTNAE